VRLINKGSKCPKCVCWILPGMDHICIPEYNFKCKFPAGHFCLKYQQGYCTRISDCPLGAFRIPIKGGK
jgi:hypothetical protein